MIMVRNPISVVQPTSKSIPNVNIVNVNMVNTVQFMISYKRKRLAKLTF